MMMMAARDWDEVKAGLFAGREQELRAAEEQLRGEVTQDLDSIPAGPLRDYELAFLHSGGVLVRTRGESFLVMWLTRDG